MLQSRRDVAKELFEEEQKAIAEAVAAKKAAEEEAAVKKAAADEAASKAAAEKEAAAEKAKSEPLNLQVSTICTQKLYDLENPQGI